MSPALPSAAQSERFDELLKEIAARGLLLPGVEIVRERHLLVSEHSTIHLRFHPDPVGVEVVS